MGIWQAYAMYEVVSECIFPQGTIRDQESSHKNQRNNANISSLMQLF